MAALSELDPLIDEAKHKWRALGVKLLPGATDSSLADFEQRHGVRLPTDLRAWFRAVGGMELGDTDEEEIRFWKLDEVQPDDDFPEFFVFADFLIWSHAYGVRFSESDTRVVMLGGPSPRLVAVSFTAFLQAYLRDSRSLFV